MRKTILVIFTENSTYELEKGQSWL